MWTCYPALYRKAVEGGWTGRIDVARNVVFAAAWLGLLLALNRPKERDLAIDPLGSRQVPQRAFQLP